MSKITKPSPCFTPGTLISTDRGPVPVERLRRGMKVVTRDNGLRRIYWAGRRDLTYLELQESPELAPILIRAGALGDRRPFNDMLVSPTHRMLVTNETSQFSSDEPETLVAAHLLTSLPGIENAACLGVSYLHILCDQHQVVLADGTWTESFHPDDQTLANLEATMQKEILALFPEVETIGAARRFGTARSTVDSDTMP